ncbi:hypothetical protein RFI_02367 [Reticulomyxa filosa]|uniref:G-protein coupled receptors family 1 profile domain-containing protein n=1 Tax=Reticulomyxa filosa TaxID=46433 RepID=X6P962_RETFI|nr:hypothetical protein RFI_02367 [Reticulomyxa filosa]|eukprot:ETO34721.1 hypothetical protein RFI_02367 [Reticulomyxa filosa]
MSESRILSVPTVFVAILSVCSCEYVCFSTWKAKQKSNVYQRNSLFVDNIFLMALCDGLNALWCILNWLPSALTIFDPSKSSLWQYDETVCKLLGMFSQFVGTSSPLWHVLIALSLFYLILGFPLSTLARHKNKLFFGIVITGIVLTIIPFCYGAYGRIKTVGNDSECWINQKTLQLTEYVPIVLSVAFHNVITVIMGVQYCRYKYKHYADVEQHLISRRPHYSAVLSDKMAAFVIVFTLVRVFPTVNRIYGLIHDSSPLWLVLLHHVSIASVGLGDGLVWYCTRKQHSSNNQHLENKMRNREPVANPKGKQLTIQTLYSSQSVDNAFPSDDDDNGSFMLSSDLSSSST